MLTNITVKNSRILIALLLGVGGLFVVVGIILLVFWVTGIFNLDSTKVWIFVVFEFFAIAIGGAITVSQIINFIRPFVMFKTDEKGIYFGTGFRYQLYFVPWELVQSATVETPENFALLGVLKNCDNVRIILKPDSNLPSSMATSAGIMYIANNLTLDGSYIDKSATEIADLMNNRIN